MLNPHFFAKFQSLPFLTLNQALFKIGSLKYGRRTHYIPKTAISFSFTYKNIKTENKVSLNVQSPKTIRKSDVSKSTLIFKVKQPFHKIV